jgi:hypothetical protein
MSAEELDKVSEHFTIASNSSHSAKSRNFENFENYVDHRADGIRLAQDQNDAT